MSSGQGTRRKYFTQQLATSGALFMCKSLSCLSATLLRASTVNQSTQNKPPNRFRDLGGGYCFVKANCFCLVLMSDTLAFACRKGEVSHLSDREGLGGVNRRMRVLSGVENEAPNAVGEGGVIPGRTVPSLWPSVIDLNAARCRVVQVVVQHSYP